MVDVGAQRVEVDLRELLRVVEVGVHRVGDVLMLAQDRQVERLRPPVAVATALVGVVAPVDDGALALASRLLHVADDGVVIVVLFGHGRSFLGRVDQVTEQAGHTPQ